MPCPSCSSAYLDQYGRCPACGYYGQPPLGGPQAAGLQPVGYGAPSAPTGVATATQILLAAQAFAQVGGIVAGVLALASLNQDGDVSSVATLVSGLTEILSIPTLLAAIVLFIIWFYKARAVADILNPGEPKVFSRGWAVGGWFTPIGFVWIPRGVAGDIWAASRPLGSVRGPSARRSGLLTAWWTCWCLMWVLALTNGGVLAANSDQFRVSDRRTYDAVGIAGSMVHLAAAVLALLVVRRITTMQQIRILQGPGADHPYAAPAAVPGGYPAPQYASQPYAPQPYAPQQYAPQPYVPTQPPAAEAVAPADVTPEDAVPAEPVVDLAKPATDDAP
ncbi:DUF4328 domain-containing protein [Streptacidiphilus sp. N1-12]|uniref:DUF4328 domain-containing protein n=2 Tax=Streptacidiphilus alkalitolerans TaxID=3342712 RepID=A0ABV6WB94_9ACTN